MVSYIIRRLLLMFPTLIGIITITFIITQFVPGGPIDQIKVMLKGHSGIVSEAGGTGSIRGNKSGQKIDPEQLKKLKKVYNLDRPIFERYLRTFLWYSPKNPNIPFIKNIFNRDNWEGFLVFKFGQSMQRTILSADNASDSERRLLTDAKSLLSNGNLTASRDICRQILKKDNSNADAIGLLALVLYQAGDEERAIRLISQAIQITPNNAIHYYRLANIHQDRGNLEEAITCYNKALCKAPKFLAALVNLGNAFFQNQNYEQAIDISLKAIAFPPITCIRGPPCIPGITELSINSETIFVLLDLAAISPQLFSKSFPIRINPPLGPRKVL